MKIEDRVKRALGECRCDDIYKRRNMIDLDCPYHQYGEEVAIEIREAIEEAITFKKLEV